MDWLFDWPDEYPQLARSVLFFGLRLWRLRRGKTFSFPGKFAQRGKSSLRILRRNSRMEEWDEGGVWIMG